MCFAVLESRKAGRRCLLQLAELVFILRIAAALHLELELVQRLIAASFTVQSHKG